MSEVDQPKPKRQRGQRGKDKKPRKLRKTVKVSPKKAAQAKRTGEMLEYRIRRFSYGDIAETMGIPESTVRNTIRRAIENIDSDLPAQVLKMDLEVLDKMQNGAIEAALAGSPQAIDAILKIMTKRHAMLRIGEFERPKTAEPEKPDESEAGQLISAYDRFTAHMDKVIAGHRANIVTVEAKDITPAGEPQKALP